MHIKREENVTNNKVLPLADNVLSATLLKSEKNTLISPVVEKKKDIIESTVTDNANIYSSPFPFVAAIKDKSGKWIVQQDIIVDENTLSFDESEQSEIAISKIEKVNYWTDKNIPYIISGDNRNLILDAIKEFNQINSYQFVEMKDEIDFVDFVFSERNICQSYLGKKGGRQEIVIGRSCNRGNILHEMMHVIGFVHEQSREDRDQFIEVIWENIVPKYKGQFQMFPRKISIPVEVDFDFNSILLYSPLSYSNGNGPAMERIDGQLFSENREKLSEIDELKLNLLFKEKAALY